MTTTNVYQGLTEKSTSRVLRAPGGGSSNIFGGYEEEAQQQQQQRRQQETQQVIQGNNPNAPPAGGDVGARFNENKGSFDANRHRNQGSGAPFATSDNVVQGDRRSDRPTHNQQVVGPDYQTPQQQQAANRSRNQGQGAPFATGDNGPSSGRAPSGGYGQGAPRQQQQTVGDDYLTPQQRQANNPNKAGNSFNNLFGDSDSGAAHGSNMSKGQGTFNPITGEEHQGKKPSTKVHAPPGGVSSIQF